VTVQTLKIGRREFVVLAKRDFQKLAAQAQQQTEDEYWTRAALEAEERAKKNGERPIPLEQVERELAARKRGKSSKTRGKRS
jgi:hypothetical protein